MCVRNDCLLPDKESKLLVRQKVYNERELTLNFERSRDETKKERTIQFGYFIAKYTQPLGMM